MPDKDSTEETYAQSHTLSIAIAINKVEAALAAIDDDIEGVAPKNNTDTYSKLVTIMRMRMRTSMSLVLRACFIMHYVRRPLVRKGYLLIDHFYCLHSTPSLCAK